MLNMSNNSESTLTYLEKYLKIRKPRVKKFGKYRRSEVIVGNALRSASVLVTNIDDNNK